MWFTKKGEKGGQKISGTTGKLMQWPGDKNVLGYFKDGIVYSQHMQALGSYSLNGNDYNVEYDGKIIGFYSPSPSGGIVYFWGNYPTGLKKLAEFWNNQDMIHPENDEVQTIIFEGDPVGAAATFLVLFCGYGASDHELKKKFMK